ncbi:hypothetical protein GCM10010361_14450 [Streptomyces olivaceiscleroticus]|uniref:Uncharacterized protein n=1 Tax=Streptomyces olivaceiscleroticus TaxID=68245 RepID=A0ABN0ZL28_9ACTN
MRGHLLQGGAQGDGEGGPGRAAGWSWVIISPAWPEWGGAVQGIGRRGGRLVCPSCSGYVRWYADVAVVSFRNCADAGGNVDPHAAVEAGALGLTGPPYG